MKTTQPILCLFITVLLFVGQPQISFGSSPADSVGVEKKDGQVLLLYKVEAGETLYSITKKYDVTIAELKQLNPQLADGLKAGQTIKIPYAIEFAPNATEAEIQAKAKTMDRQHQPDIHYVVQPGETYYGISKKFDVTVAQLQKLNGEVLKAGQVLILPSTTQKPEPPKLAAGKKQADAALILYPPKSEQPRTRDQQPQTPAEQIKNKPDPNPKPTPKAKPEVAQTTNPKPEPKPKPQPKTKTNTKPAATEKDKAMVALEKPKQPQNDDPLAGEDDFGAATNETPKPLPGYPDDGTRRVLIIPFDPYLYFSDADEEIAEGSQMPRNKVRTVFRRRLNALIDPMGYETIHLLGGTARDSLKDLDRIYKSISYFKSTIVYDPLNDPEAATGINLGAQDQQRTWWQKQKGKLNAQTFRLANNDRNELKYYGVKVNDPQFWDYFNNKYHVQYYVFINQFEIKTNYENCIDRARQDYERNFIAHFTIFDNTGHLVAGNKVKIFYNSNSNQVFQIVNENMQKMADAIIARIPKQ